MQNELDKVYTFLMLFSFHEDTKLRDSGTYALLK